MPLYAAHSNTSMRRLYSGSAHDAAIQVETNALAKQIQAKPLAEAENS